MPSRNAHSQPAVRSPTDAFSSPEKGIVKTGRSASILRTLVENSPCAESNGALHLECLSAISTSEQSKIFNPNKNSLCTLPTLCVDNSGALHLQSSSRKRYLWTVFLDSHRRKLPCTHTTLCVDNSGALHLRCSSSEQYLRTVYFDSHRRKIFVNTYNALC